jgi:pimeloyl-ACP methyl ester carboxylesterase
VTQSAYKLHVVERGKGRPVILLHGALSTHRYWNGVAAHLEAERRLLLPDLLGYGSSPKPRQASYSVAQFIACLEHTFEQYTFKTPPILAGHSLGANIALKWALQNPEKFSGLVLSSPLLFEKSMLHQQLATLPLEGKWLAHKSLAKIVAFMIGLAGLVPLPVAMRFSHNRPRHVMEDVTSQKFYVFRKLLKNNYFSEEVLLDMGQLRMPTWIVLGDQDRIANHAIDKLQELCKKQKSCNVQILPGSHQILLEHPEKVAKTILSI